ncbi:MAG: LLM class flavin-dependent oxidoreductase [Chloroflexota bacterium]|nr:LLM class flavin-dependent oxidoreductase [Chloroflexota bacterium]MDE2961786.1 LLM class flavin-dependent oxidoreductase [Chloroflexota bacterium]
MAMILDQAPIKFNVRVNQYRYSYADLLRIWQEADRLGYYSASLFDLLTVDALECWTTLTALLAQTERIRAVPMVLANQYRHPVLTAKMAATLDVISGGRITLGIGAGGSRSDTEHSGLPFPSTRQRCEMLEESLTIIRRLWTEPSVNFDGKHYRVSGASVEPKPTQSPAPPVLVGGHGPHYVLPAIGRTADICNVGSNDTVEQHRGYAGIIRQAAEAAGRDPDSIELTHNADCVIAPTQRDYERLVARLAGEAGMTASTYQADRLRNTLSGTPEQICDRLGEYVEFGIRYFFVVFPNPAPSETLALFAGEVMNRFNI